MVLITSAKFCGQWLTPYQFEQKKELINKSKKKNCESLRCADGCELIFKRVLSTVATVQMYIGKPISPTKANGKRPRAK